MFRVLGLYFRVKEIVYIVNLGIMAMKEYSLLPWS